MPLFAAKILVGFFVGTLIGLTGLGGGVLLVFIPMLLMFQTRIEERMVNRSPTLKSFLGMTIIGLGSGFLVGMTSVGSGSIIMMMLLLFYSYPPKVNVGTDIVHAVVLTG